jgi:hypothetical protein
MALLHRARIAEQHESDMTYAATFPSFLRPDFDERVFSHRSNSAPAQQALQMSKI